jgi:hypothetical protein
MILMRKESANVEATKSSTAHASSCVLARKASRIRDSPLGATSNAPTSGGHLAPLWDYVAPNRPAAALVVCW